MNVVEIDSNKASQWDAYVIQNPLSIAWQQYGWSDVLNQNYKTRFYPLAALRGKEICGVLPLYYYKSAKGHALISVPFAVAGGIVADDMEAERALLNQAISISRSYGGCQIRLKQYKHKIEGDLQVDDNYYNRELTMTQDMTALREKITSENIRKAEEGMGFGFRINRSPSIDAFYRLMKAHHHRKGVPCVSRRWVESLVHSKWYTMATIEYNGKVISGTMLKNFKDTVSFPFTCAQDDSRESATSLYYLYWELIQSEAQKGTRIFHSGRIPINNDTDVYRMGWGGEKNQYFNQYFPNTVTQVEFVQKRGGKRELFQKVWKKAPGFVVDQLGPLIVRQFP